MGHYTDTHAREEPSVVDQLEPIEESNEYREASRKMLSFLFRIVEYLSSYQNVRELEVRLWSLASALQHPCLEGLSDLELAEMLGRTRASVSKDVLDFERRNGFTVGLGRKSLATRVKYSFAHGATNRTRDRENLTALRHLTMAIGICSTPRPCYMRRR
jgi:hypothetical protein